MNSPTTDTIYRTIVADPPWQFGDALPGGGRGAAKHYSLLSLDNLTRFSLPLLAPDCRLFLWRVAAMQEEALAVMRAWGFTLKAEVVWLKRTSTGKRHFGMGRTVRMEHEICLIGSRGRPELLSHSVRSTFNGPHYEVETEGDVFEAKVGRHSEKPDTFYSLVEQLSPGPYVELFARRQRPGWTCLGDEVPLAVKE